MYVSYYFILQDMELIDILFMQDIDIGIARDAYNTNASQNQTNSGAEKLQVELDTENQQVNSCIHLFIKEDKPQSTLDFWATLTIKKGWRWSPKIPTSLFMLAIPEAHLIVEIFMRINECHDKFASNYVEMQVSIIIHSTYCFCFYILRRTSWQFVQNAL